MWAARCATRWSAISRASQSCSTNLRQRIAWIAMESMPIRRKTQGKRSGPHSVLRISSLKFIATVNLDFAPQSCVSQEFTKALGDNNFAHFPSRYFAPVPLSCPLVRLPGGSPAATKPKSARNSQHSLRKLPHKHWLGPHSCHSRIQP